MTSRPVVVFVALVIALPWAHASAQQASPAPAAGDELAKTREDIAAKEQEIADLNRRIQELAGKRDATAEEAALIESKVLQLNQQLQKAELELKQTNLTISQVQTDQEKTASSIEELKQKVEERRTQLVGLLRLLYEREQESIVRLFFSTWSFSEVMTERAALEDLRNQTVTVIQEIHQEEDRLSEQQQALQEREQELVQLESILAGQQDEIATQRAEQQRFLAAKESEKVTYERRIKEAEEARQEIERHVFTLKDAGVEVSLNNAFDMARYAHKLTGVRPELLLAVLKVESNLGENTGSGKFPDDMQPQSRDAFLRITKKLGLDPNTAPISRRPASGRGWGGAMGPSQIMPATWESLEGRLETLIGKKPVNPYELSDAFVASAVFLADRGAAAGKEREALARYVAGPNWPYWVNSWYTDRVMAVVAEYEKEF